jgi:hypothetical protein
MFAIVAFGLCYAIHPATFYEGFAKSLATGIWVFTIIGALAIFAYFAGYTEHNTPITVVLAAMIGLPLFIGSVISLVVAIVTALRPGVRALWRKRQQVTVDEFIKRSGEDESGH